MTYSLSKELQSSKKFFLVKVTPTRSLDGAFDSSPATDILVFDLDGTLDLVSVYEGQTFAPYNKATFTEVNTPSVALGEYYFDKENNKIYLGTLGTAPGGRLYFVDYALYLTTGGHQIIGKDPEDPKVDLRQWEDRIIGEAFFRQSITNVSTGLISISISPINVANPDNAYNKYFTPKDSWKNARCEAWHCIDEVENIKKLYLGLIADVTFADDSFTLEVREYLEELRKTAFLDSEAREYGGAYLPTVSPDDVGIPVPFHFGPSSQMNYFPEYLSGWIGPDTELDGNLVRAVNVTFTTTVSTTTNRTWHCGLGMPVASWTLSYAITGVRQAIISGTNCRIQINMTADTIKEIVPGDWVTVAISGAGADTCKVLFDPFPPDYYGGTPSFYVEFNSGILPAVNFTGTVSLFRIPQAHLVRQGVVYELIPSVHYSVPSSTTPDGNRNFYLVLANNFEASTSPPISALDVETDVIYARLIPGEFESNHAKVLQFLIEKTNFLIDSASFIAAQSALDAQVMFSIPSPGETEVGTFEQYLGNILKSTFGYLFLKDSDVIGYKLFADATPTVEVTDNEIVEDSLSITVNHDDLITQIKFNHPENTYLGWEDYTQEEYRSYEIEFLSKSQVREEFEHFMFDIRDRSEKIFTYKSRPQVYYNLEAKGTLLDANIGDDILIKTTGLLGGVSEVAVKIISIDNGVDSTRITAIDLDGI